MEKKFDVIGFGDPFQDLDIQLSRLPETNVNMRMVSTGLPRCDNIINGSGG